MTDAPLILGFDTSGPYCAAALLRGEVLLAETGEDMARGQAERLMGLLEDVLRGQGCDWRDLDALAVGTGPGNFTGIRIGVSAARGLALGLGIPAYGVTGFEARARLAPKGSTVTVPAPRDMVYVLEDGAARQIPAQDVDSAPAPLPAHLARAIALHACSQWPTRPPAPAPFYARPPDAAPARDAPPRVLP
ncbi:tRNA (adenosine(37)-N6)-threonylcarbamoyltransferase complex dimerization subunit type 1 TsaB [uncultured Tateyamaria sp.]|uniref:tRNA (adenosine(37)-N6)-threonylcarbamoyltransferase complex dimerization subunit type 1 TsaB n=1 Tax=uncultured Tateyamaria sp. TaxID=455651 RepID=UPI0026074EC7|nr:tRNA (adenosine(37)-N6)-threonylcarbamoyltransferase complex dimerization subunit type 1 TsaB [uncultured Tateyamaria sp.]